jgi:hypothetical protein
MQRRAKGSAQDDVEEFDSKESQHESRQRRPGGLAAALSSSGVTMVATLEPRALALALAGSGDSAALCDSDSVLIVQYALPVRLRREVDGATAPGA